MVSYTVRCASAGNFTVVIHKKYTPTLMCVQKQEPVATNEQNQRGNTAVLLFGILNKMHGIDFRRKKDPSKRISFHYVLTG